MSDRPRSGVTLEPPKQGKGDRILSALRLSKKKELKFEPLPLAEDVSQFSFKAADVDIGEKFAKLKLRNIKLPTSIPVVVTIDIAGEGANLVRTDKYVCDAISKLAVDAINQLSDKVAGLLKAADPDADDVDKKQFVSDTVIRQFEWLETTAAIDIVKRVEAYPAYVKYAEKSVKKWKIKCGASIVLSGVVIVGGAAITGLTWGAAGPAAVVGIARSCVQLAHTIGDLVANIDQVGWMIKKQLLVLQSMMEADEEGDSTKESGAKKAMNSVKNAGLGAVSGLLGAKSIPTIKNCEGYIETYEVKRLELDVKLAKLGPQIFPLEAGIKALKIDLSNFEGSAATTLQKFLDAAESQHGALETHVADLDRKSRKATSNKKNWSEALEEISVHGWTNHVSTLVGAVTDLGLAAGGSAPDGLMAGLGALISLEASITDQLIDKF